MTRKDFETIAAALHEQATHNTPATHARYAASMADALASTNGRFDRERFLAACGVGDARPKKP